MRDTIFYASKDEKITPQEIAHADLARKLAGECMVLLENDGVLPLKSRGEIALYGNGVRKTIQGGNRIRKREYQKHYKYRERF